MDEHQWQHRFHHNSFHITSSERRKPGHQATARAWTIAGVSVLWHGINWFALPRSSPPDAPACAHRAFIYQDSYHGQHHICAASWLRANQLWRLSGQQNSYRAADTLSLDAHQVEHKRLVHRGSALSSYHLVFEKLASPDATSPQSGKHSVSGIVRHQTSKDGSANWTSSSGGSRHRRDSKLAAKISAWRITLASTRSAVARWHVA